MNIKHYIISTVCVFVFFFFFDWMYHGVILMDLYNQTPHLWRSPEAMQALFPMAPLLQLLFAAALTFLFTRHYEARGVGEGVRFGLVTGLLIGVGQLGSYPYMPISLVLAILWFLGALVSITIAGVILSLTYRMK